MWQVAGFLGEDWNGQTATRPYSTTLPFMLCTGIGDSLGVVFGFALLALFENKVGGVPFDNSTFLRMSGALVMGCTLDGGTWEAIVVLCANHGTTGMPFSEAMVVTGLVCGSLFWLGLTLGRLTFRLPQAMLTDISLAVACGGGSGCFVATDKRFRGNWMGKVLGERHGDRIVDCFLAGCSTLIGFLIVQIVLCAVLPYGWCWCDAAQDTFPPDDGQRISTTLLSAEQEEEDEEQRVRKWPSSVSILAQTLPPDESSMRNCGGIATNSPHGQHSHTV